MKFVITVFLISLLSFAACIYLPWWSVAIVSFIVSAVVNISSVLSFLAGFLAVFLLWLCISYSISVGNGHILAHRIAPLIIKADSPLALALLTGIIGASVAGLGALAGSFIRSRAA